MQRLNKSSVSTVFRTSIGSRYRAASSFHLRDSASESNWAGGFDSNVRSYSVLTSSCGPNKPCKMPNREMDFFLGRRFESTAATSDGSDLPAEKHEYKGGGNEEKAKDVEQELCADLIKESSLICDWMKRKLRDKVDSLHKAHKANRQRSSRENSNRPSSSSPVAVRGKFPNMDRFSASTMFYLRNKM